MIRQLTITPQLMKQPPACRECGCKCSLCQSNSLDWHHHIEELNAKLVETTTRAAQSENELMESRCKIEQDYVRLQEDLVKQRDRYDRLYESHKKLQKVNNDLEDKLLTIVEKLNRENEELKGSLLCMQSKLTEVETCLQYHEDECERLKKDCIIAVQLLQCRRSDFVSYKLNELPVSLKERVRSQLSHQELLELEEDEYDIDTSSKPVHVPITTFPPTAVSFLRAKSSENSKIHRVSTVPMDLVARVLLPSSAADDIALTQRRRGDAYMCASCRRCDVATHGNGNIALTNSRAVVDTANDSFVGSDHREFYSAGVHTPRKSSSQSAYKPVTFEFGSNQ